MQKTVNERNVEALPPVRFEVGGKEISLDSVNRLARRLLEAQARKYASKYSGLKGPGGERPTVVIRSPRLLDRNLQVVLEYPEGMKDFVAGHDMAVRVA